MADLPAVYADLWRVGAELGLADFASHALNSLRMEKAYLTRFELTHDIGPRQAGVDRWLNLDKGPFIGKDAIAPPPTDEEWRLAYLEVDVPNEPGAADCVGGEGVFVGDAAVGLTTSGGYGYTVAKSLAFAYVHASHALAGTELEVLILGERRRAVVLAEPAFDPENKELLG